MLGVWTASCTHAAVGQSATELQKTVPHLKASYHTTYTRYDYQNPQGIDMHEFSDPSTGKIFALRWSGNRPYPLSKALGNTPIHLPTPISHDHHHYHYRDAHIVVDSTMYLNHFSGQVYRPDQLPAYTTIQDIH